MLTNRAFQIAIAGLLGCLTHGGTALAQDEFINVVNLAVPAEIADAATNAQLLTRLLNPTIADPQLSKAFDPRQAYLAVDPRSRLTPDPSCMRQKEPGNDPSAFNDKCVFTQGETTGELPLVQLRFNLARGKFAYLNRGRSFDFTRSPENTVPLDVAQEAALALSSAFGIPSSELDRAHVDVRQSIAATGPTVDAFGAVGAGPVEQKKVAEVHVRVPRIVGELPVFDSLFLVAMGDDGTGKPLAARVRGQWPDFRLLPGMDPSLAFDRQTLVGLIAGRLRQHTLTGTLQTLLVNPVNRKPFGTRGYIAYVPVGQLEVCFDTSDERGLPPGQGGPGEVEARPQDLARLYVPALVLFAVPRIPERQPLSSTRPPSTGIEQLSFPLLDISRQLCSGSV